MVERPVAFVRGWEDELAGKGFLDNPYPEATDDFRIWIDGKVDCIRARHFPPIWTIYDHPKDAPDHFVVRVWYGPIAEPHCTHHDSLEDARLSIHALGGCVPFRRDPSDDPVIVESWI